MTTDRIDRLLTFVMAALFAASLAGCASLTKKQSGAGSPAIAAPAADVAPARAARREDAVAQIDRRRDRAQFEAALSRASEGALDDCELVLRNLLARNPRHREARLLLTETLLATHKMAEAEEQLRSVLAEDPNDAQAHFLLGALLETTGRAGHAQAHFERVASIDPNFATLRESRPAAPARPAQIAQQPHRQPFN
jgi:predicted Zn-dependent protease